MTRPLHSDAYAKFVAVLASVRDEYDLTQQEVADRLGKPQSYIAKTEGRERRIDVVEMIALAKAIGIDPKLLFDRVLETVEDKTG